MEFKKQFPDETQFELIDKLTIKLKESSQDFFNNEDQNKIRNCAFPVVLSSAGMAFTSDIIASTCEYYKDKDTVLEYLAMTEKVFQNCIKAIKEEYLDA